MNDDNTLNLGFIERFEEAWLSGQPPRLSVYLPPADSESFLATLQELVIIDLEFYWKRFSATDSPSPQSIVSVEDYVERYPVLSDAPILRRLVEEEFVVRRKYGDRPDASQFIKRFPQFAARIEKLNSDYPVDGPRPISKTSSPAAPDIENYTLIREIGEGGMGSVYLARQEHPVRRSVALKVIRRGLDSTDVIARFEAERQALAMMDHQNIARIYQGGATEQGQPFFAMEHVDGIPLTNYCRQNRLSIPRRLELFSDICSAVQHAHQKGILHRDLKPGNVLVAEEDGRAIVKVIDFGLAKAIDSTELLTDKTIFTQAGQVLGTLKYMSPEQASTHQQDVDTRADVYALGVMLYELLTGQTPLDEQSMRGQGVLSVLEMIRDHEPVRPSVKIGSADVDSKALLSERGISSAGLNHALRGDLDWIVMKALEKDRNRRYDSVGSLSDDVRRFLDDEPVTARPPSASYRLQKFARKNRVLVSTAATVLCLLVVGIAATSWQAVRAIRAEHKANKQTLFAQGRQRFASEQQQIAVARAIEAENRRVSTEMLLRMEKEVRRQRDHQTYFYGALKDDAELATQLLIESFAKAGAVDGVETSAASVLLKAREALEQMPKYPTPGAQRFEFDNPKGPFLEQISKGFSGLGEFDKAITTAEAATRLQVGTRALGFLAKAYDSAGNADQAKKIAGLIRRHHWYTPPLKEFGPQEPSKLFSGGAPLLPMAKDYEEFKTMFHRVDLETQLAMSPLAKTYRSVHRYAEAKLIDQQLLQSQIDASRSDDPSTFLTTNFSQERNQTNHRLAHTTSILAASHDLITDHLGLGETDKAIKLSRECVALLNEKPWVQMSQEHNVNPRWRFQPPYDLATALLEGGEEEQAIEEFIQLLQAIEDDESFAQFEEGSVDQVIARYQTYLSTGLSEEGQFSFHEKVRYGLARAYLRGNRIDEAIAVYQTLDSEPSKMLALVFAAAGKPAMAAHAYQRLAAECESHDNLKYYASVMLHGLLQMQLWANEVDAAATTMAAWRKTDVNTFLVPELRQGIDPLDVELLAMNGEFDQAIKLSRQINGYSNDAYQRLILTLCRLETDRLETDSDKAAAMEDATKTFEQLYSEMGSMAAWARWRVVRGCERMVRICELLERPDAAEIWRTRVAEVEKRRFRMACGAIPTNSVRYQDDLANTF